MKSLTRFAMLAATFMLAATTAKGLGIVWYAPVEFTALPEYAGLQAALVYAPGGMEGITVSREENQWAVGGATVVNAATLVYNPSYGANWVPAYDPEWGWYDEYVYDGEHFGDGAKVAESFWYNPGDEWNNDTGKYIENPGYVARNAQFRAPFDAYPYDPANPDLGDILYMGDDEWAGEYWQPTDLTDAKQWSDGEVAGLIPDDVDLSGLDFVDPQFYMILFDTDNNQYLLMEGIPTGGEFLFLRSSNGIFLEVAFGYDPGAGWFPVPEPAAAALLAVGATVIGLRRRRRG